ncbi:leucyl aminopeptidase [Enemella sp. A6]|uniref:leucyl aminopeptidase n=1 Tax=Enemella sp. A6 TaxID=3440152 RepID=UPI003EBEDF31
MSDLPQVHVSRKLPKSDVIVLGVVGPTEDTSLLVPDVLGKSWAKRALPSYRLDSEAGKASLVPGPGSEHLILVGLGEDDSPATLRKAAGQAVRLAVTSKFEQITVALPTDEPEELAATVEGAVLGAYRVDKLAKTPEDSPAPKITLITDHSQKQVDATLAVARAVAIARDLVNVPPNLLYPETFAERARQIHKGSKVTVKVWEPEDLAAEGFGGLTTVGGGSSRGPRLVQMSYSPRGAKTHLALVGKGITFDSGGLNLKPADGMYTMKCDMAGAAAVISAVRAIADLGLKVQVTGYAPMAENLPSSTAYRPSDVLTMYGGLTVENANTDAEGRLVMADALARASEDKPDVVLDIATLTGACMVALGNSTAGVMSDYDDLAERVLAAAESAGEPFWRLPLTEEATKSLKSTIADVRSSGKSRYGGALVAGAFLRKFVPESIAWAHLDIAGPAWRDEPDAGADSNGGTGFGVRTLVEVARSLAE